MKKHHCYCGWSGYYPNVIDISEDPQVKKMIQTCPDCDSTRVNTETKLKEK